MPLQTLVEYAKGLQKTDIRRPLIETFAASSDYASALPFEAVNGSSYEFYREASIGQANFRAINQPSTKSRGKLDPYSESTYIIDVDLDVDRAIVDRQGAERRAREEKMQMAAQGQLWAQTFIKGDNESNPLEFNGLQKRCSLDATRRVLNNSTASGGAALSLANLDRLIFAVKNATHIFAPYELAPAFIGAARDTSISGFVMQTWDELGMPKLSYAGRPILWGYQRDLNPAPLAFNEVAVGGGSAVTSSLYAAHLGEDGVKGLQLKPMSAEDVGLLEDRITYRTHVSWDVGMVDEHTFSCARLTSVTNGAITK